jgi:hypothetical protein
VLLGLRVRPPVIALTGSRDEAIAVALLKAGADDYLAKDHLTSERLRHTLRTTVDAARERTRMARADAALRDLAAIAETADSDCMPALVAAIGRAWHANACACSLLGEGASLIAIASWGTAELFTEDRSVTIMRSAIAHGDLMRAGRYTALPLRDHQGEAVAVIAIADDGLEPHPLAVAVLRVAAGRALAALERASQQRDLERSWRHERAVATAARELLACDRIRRDPSLALRNLLEGFDADRVLLLAADENGMTPAFAVQREGIPASSWVESIAWRPRLRRWATELNDGASIAAPVDTLPGDEAHLLEADAIGAIALFPIHVGNGLAAVLRLDAKLRSHWSRDRLRALRHATHLLQAWWQRDAKPTSHALAVQS